MLEIINNLFNCWKEFPKYKPKKPGWYLCTCKFPNGKYEYQTYVMELWWVPSKEVWRDNRRLSVFQEYDVFGYGNQIEKHKLYDDPYCFREDVIGFKKLPKGYKERNYE